MANREKKVSLSVTLPREMIDYLTTKVDSREFASYAHGIELCIRRYKENKEKKNA